MGAVCSSLPTLCSVRGCATKSCSINMLTSCQEVTCSALSTGQAAAQPQHVVGCCWPALTVLLMGQCRGMLLVHCAAVPLAELICWLFFFGCRASGCTTPACGWVFLVWPLWSCSWVGASRGRSWWASCLSPSSHGSPTMALHTSVKPHRSKVGALLLRDTALDKCGSSK